MATGTVLWFNRVRGYGFINREDDLDPFVHYSEIITEHVKYLHEGEKVIFDIEELEKGPVVVNIELIKHEKERNDP